MYKQTLHSNLKSHLSDKESNQATFETLLQSLRGLPRADGVGCCAAQFSPRLSTHSSDRIVPNYRRVSSIAVFACTRHLIQNSTQEGFS